jgi:hypothetical protein
MIKRSMVSCLSVVFLATLLLLTLPSQADAKRKVKHKKSKTIKYLYLDASLGISYDDNVINYSDADLNLFSNDSLQGKFAIQSKDDWIIVPQIRPRLKASFLGGQTAWVSLGFDYYNYIQNDVLRYERITLEGRQYYSSKGYGQLTYSYIPNYYYRNYTVGRDQYGFDIFHEAKYSKHSVALETGYDFTRLISGTVIYNYQHRSFNKEFNFRSTNLNGIDLQGMWKVLPMVRIWAYYGYESSRAKGADMPDTIVDVSYDAWDITFGARYYAPFLKKYSPELFSAFQFRNIKYQSDRPLDAYRLGRKDNNYLLRIGVACRIHHDFQAELTYSYLQKKAQLPDLYPNGNVRETTSQLENELNYKSNIILLRFSRTF